MKRYGKLINGQIEYAPTIIQEDDMLVIPPSEAQLITLGYKEIITLSPPLPPEGYNYEFAGWDETETQIIQQWNLVEIPITEQTPQDYLYQLLFG
ncbi:MAG: hypothetical protein LBI45_07205 [Bacteroidales bacterium]|jgi:hypothetical protein|nr:hypothetical protein [Bacteroidales bacterium]